MNMILAALVVAVATIAPTSASWAAKPAKAAATQAVTGPVLPSCSWDRPGVNPFQGDVVAAVDRYQDIPSATRDALKKRMAKRNYDEIATIRRDSIEGSHRYTDLRDMHFGKGQICSSVTRDKWKPQKQERGLVYCEDGHCIIVPTACRNVSRVTRKDGERQTSSTPVEEKAGGNTPSGYVSLGEGPEPEPGSFDSQRGFESGQPPAEVTTFAGGSGMPAPFEGSSVTTVMVTIPGTSLGGDLPVASQSGASVAAPVPEPETWMMMLIGAIFLGITVRRRRRQLA